MRSLKLFLMSLTLGLALAGTTGCGPTTPDAQACETHADCPTGEACNADKVCETPANPCVLVSCPGAQICDPSNGECKGDCCTTTTCGDPRTSCDETACAAGAANPCVAKTCGPGDNLGCQPGFTCNQLLATPACEADCLSQRCAETSQHCNATTGACEDRLPLVGEVGTACGSDADCGSGLTCLQLQNGNKFCTAFCANDSECPNGSWCDQICWDACTPEFGDCARDFQCMTYDGDVNSRCLPIFAQSDCDPNTSTCKPNGSVCSTADDCEPDSACVDYGGGKLCQQINCGAFGNECGAGESCLGLGADLTACFTGCDAANPSACDALSATNTKLSCVAQPAIVGPGDASYIAVDAAGCNADFPDAKQVTVGGQTAFICHKACTANADCGPGQFCEPLETQFNDGSTTTVSACVNYDVNQGTCPAACGTTGCTPLNTGGQGAYAVCHESCDTDADCTDAFGGSCSRLTFGTGDSISICLYDYSGAMCFFGCEGNADCNYCQTDADCGVATGPNGTRRPKKCDIPSNSCVTPISGVTEVNSWCSSGSGFKADGYTDTAGATGGACRRTCVDDKDCSGACTNGFCDLGASLCNGATGQCEEPCAAGADCLHGSCATGEAGDQGGRCVLGCAATTDDCSAFGTCDTAKNYCAYDCTKMGCATGTTCNTTSKQCE